MHEPTIWMNVTTSVNWGRPPVGIVRVERSLCAELERIYGARFKRCVWEDGDFVIWDQPEQIAPVSSSAPSVETNSSAPQFQWIFPLVPKKQALKLVAQGLLSLAPNRIRPWVNQCLSSIKINLGPWIVPRRGKLKLLYHKLCNRVVSKVEPPRDPLVIGGIFSRGDILISVGLDWDRSFYKSFYFLRKDKGLKVVTCCYDLIPVLYPQYCVGEVAHVFTSYFLEIADGSDLILCISRQSEKDLVNLLNATGGPRTKTQVFPLGDNVPRSSGQEISEEMKAIMGSPFVLFVSSIERRKNHEVLYKAYHLLCEAGYRENLPKLVFVGMQGWGVADLMNDIRLDPLTRDLILQLNHVTDDELYALYQSSLFCVFPSFYEGWGLPVAEALAMGKAVIASAQGSLPEVGGDLVQYVDPWNTRDWAEALLKMSTDEVWRSEWESKIMSSYNVRSWVDAAKVVSEAIEQI